LIAIEGDRKDTALFVLLLWELTQRYPQAQKIHVGLPHVLWALEKERILEREESMECPRSVARIRPSSSGKPWNW
jgi:hypothetical protein